MPSTNYYLKISGDAHCPRQNGVYPSENPSECDIFYSCLNGVGSATKCAEGLHYSEEVGRQFDKDDIVAMFLEALYSAFTKWTSYNTNDQ